MSIKRGESLALDMAPPCVRCGAPSACDVWGFRVCLGCEADWHRAPELEPMLVRPLDTPLAEACRLWTEATATWLKTTRMKGAA
jgi:hypothetical protein